MPGQLPPVVPLEGGPVHCARRMLPGLEALALAEARQPADARRSVQVADGVRPAVPAPDRRAVMGPRDDGWPPPVRPASRRSGCEYCNGECRSVVIPRIEFR